MNRLTLLVLIALVVAACKVKPDKDEIQTAQDEARFDETSAALEERFGDLYETLPVSELAGFLQSVNAEYNPSFVNDPSNAESYLATPEYAALNLGLYYTDLHYVAAFGQTDQAMAIYDAMSTLADSIGTGRALNQALLADFDGEMSPETKQMLEKALTDASSNLNTSNRPQLSTLVLVGIVVERLHLIHQTVDQVRADEELSEDLVGLMVTPLLKAAMEQKPHIDRLVEAVNLIRGEEIGEGLQLIYELQNVYTEYAEIGEEMDRTEVVDAGALDSLFEVVTDIRNAITTAGDST